MVNGWEAEEMFKKMMLERGHKIVPSSKNENMFGHFDFVVDGKKVEVKSEKALNRGEESSPIFWIEAINVRGDIGWLFGESDYIAFLHNMEFLIVDTEALRKYIRENIPGESAPTGNKGYKKWYRRYGRMDSVTYIYPMDIEKLIVQRLKINTK